MSKVIRILVVFACMAVVVGVGLNGAAWADKLNVGEQAPAARALGQVMPAGSRPKGTVDTTPPCVVTKAPGSFTVASVATWLLNQVGGGIVYKACVTNGKALPANMPGALLTNPIKLTVAKGATLGVEEKVCFPVPPGKDASAYYWDGKTWVKTEDVTNGQACVTVPASAPSPTYAGLFQKP